VTFFTTAGMASMSSTLTAMGGIQRKAPDGSDIPAEKRQRELRWMPPIAVNVDDIDAMPAVVKKVTVAPKI
jgi:hypothetical protein